MLQFIIFIIFFAGRAPMRPYRITVPARRTLRLRLRDLAAPSPVPRDGDFWSVFEPGVPSVVQHTRRGSRHGAVRATPR
jgi:hypothetical protein